MIFNHKLVLEDEHKYKFYYNDAFGITQSVVVPTCVYYNLTTRVSGTASNIVENYIGQITSISHPNRQATVIIAHDKYLTGRYLHAPKLYDIVWIFEHFRLGTELTYIPEHLILPRQPLYFNLHSINIEYLNLYNEIVGTIRIDPYTHQIFNQELLDGLTKLREQYV